MIDVDLRFSSRKTIGLQVDREGRLIVRAPFGTPKKTIEQAVSANGAWIERAKEKQREKALRRPEPTAEEMKRATCISWKNGQRSWAFAPRA